jgi:hypothetical protein
MDSYLFDLVEVYACDCRPNFTYKSKATYKSHEKSKRHAAWLVAKTQRNVRCHEKEMENENETLRNRIKELEGQVRSLFEIINNNDNYTKTI